MFPRPGISDPTQAKHPPDDFWPPRPPVSTHRLSGYPSEPAIFLRLAGIVAVIAIMIAAALISA